MICHIDSPLTKQAKNSKLLILDRDGVINKDEDGYFCDKNNIVFIDKNIELIKEYTEKGWTLCVATNQSGIGRGYFSETVFKELCEVMFYALKDQGILIDRWYYCPHNPEQVKCKCRKPLPGMLLQAINYYKPNKVLFIGDKETDRMAANNAKIRFIKV